MILRVLVLVLACFCPSICAAPGDYEGKPIRAFEFVPERQPLSRREILRNLNLRQDALLNSRELSDALERLYATGRFEDIVVEVEARADGVALIFKTTPSWFVGRVTVTGVPEPPNPGQLANATQLEAGTRYVPRSLDEAAGNLVEMLRLNGLYRVKVAPQEQNEPENDQVNISFLVDAGARAKFGRPVFKGDLLYPENKLIRMARFRSWLGFGSYREATNTRAQSAIDRLRGAYRSKEFLTSRVTLEKLDYDEASNTAVPTILFDKGPKIQVRAEGAKVSRNKLKQLVPIYQEQAVDKDLLMEGARNLEQYFEAQGYFNAVADFAIGDTQNGTQPIRFMIERGKRSKLVSIGFEGNRYFDKGTLQERMYIRPANFLQYRYGRVSGDFLKKDREAIAELYRSNGFRGVEINSEIEDNYRGRKNQLAVLIKVKEGAQWFVSNLELSGVNLQFYEMVRGFLQSTPGQPYSDVSIAADRNSILNYYYNNGYPDAAFEFSVKEAADPNRVELSYVINEGPRRFVRTIIVSGLTATRPALVYKRISLKPGDPLSLNAVTESQRALYDLGIFAKVDTAIQNPDGRERNKSILYGIEEARRWALDFGFGAELGRIGGGSSSNFDNPAGKAGFSPRVSVGVSRSNLFGVGHTVAISFRYSNIQQRAVLTYLAPQFQGNPNWNLNLSALYDLSKNVNTYTAQREETTAQMSQKVSKAATLQYRLAFRRVSTADLKIDPALIPLYSQPVQVITAGGSHILDRRDDSAETHHGFFNTIDFALAASLLGPTEKFTRLVWRNSTYHRVSRQVTFARSFSLGLINGFPGTRPEDIPLPERLYGGGATTHRGFPENQAGPRDQVTGFPIGGSTSLFNNLEVRFPLVGENLGGVVFHDLGNVYRSIKDVSFRWSQPKSPTGNPDPNYSTNYGFGYAVQAFGFGIRYRTPIGPVRFDIAYVPNSPEFRGLAGTRDEILSGRGRTTIQRISRFQFHFSIGQTF